jgi:hypothetical protein
LTGSGHHLACWRRSPAVDHPQLTDQEFPLKFIRAAIAAAAVLVAAAATTATTASASTALVHPPVKDCGICWPPGYHEA